MVSMHGHATENESMHQALKQSKQAKIAKSSKQFKQASMETSKGAGKRASNQDRHCTSEYIDQWVKWWKRMKGWRDGRLKWRHAQINAWISRWLKTKSMEIVNIRNCFSPIDWWRPTTSAGEPHQDRTAGSTSSLFDATREQKYVHLSEIGLMGPECMGRIKNSKWDRTDWKWQLKWCQGVTNIWKWSVLRRDIRVEN